MAIDLNISVLIATSNRAEDLRQTLECMSRLRCDGLTAEFVIIDNNSTDHTKQVVESFADRLPVRYLFEPRPGKNCALNRALDEIEVGEIVVFTDDDVSPREDWLVNIAATCKRWPDHYVFGGRIDLTLPHEEPPGWETFKNRPGLRFGAQDFGDSEEVNPIGRYPNGANFWVRREVFANGRRYNETVGPRPKKRLMGSETHFLRDLEKDDYRIVYSPSSVVRHRIQPENFNVSAIKKRAYRLGRSGPHWKLCLVPLLEKRPLLWYLRRVGSLGRYLALYVGSFFSFSRDKRVVRRVSAIWGIAYNLETLKVAREYQRERAGSRS